MDLTHKPTKILVTGASGTGKTTFWTRYLLGTPARVKFVFDHQGEMAVRLGVPAALDLPQLAQMTAQGWAIFDPAHLFPGRTPEGFNFFCDFAFNVAQRTPGRKVFACDELQALTDTNSLSEELSMVLETGRRYSLDAAMISQAPNLIHNRVRNQLTEVVTFRQVDARAVQWLTEADFSEVAVRGLRPGWFIAKNLTTGGMSSGKVF